MDGFRLAREITKKNGQTFYFASRLLKKEKRLAAYAVYALCRASDDAVDKNQGSLAIEHLAELQDKIASAYKKAQTPDPLLQAFAKTVHEYQIPQEYFNTLINGMQMDLTKKRYRDFTELYDYSYKAAGVVGLIMLRIFGYNKPQAEDHAVKLAVAMQLTNILRDIKEDYLRGRIYLPVDEMQCFATTEDDIAKCRVNENFKTLMRFQIQRARDYFEKAKPGIKMISDANSRFVVRAMSEVYSGILREIEKNDYDIFSKRARVNNFKKITTVLKILTIF